MVWLALMPSVAINMGFHGCHPGNRRSTGGPVCRTVCVSSGQARLCMKRFRQISIEAGTSISGLTFRSFREVQKESIAFVLLASLQTDCVFHIRRVSLDWSWMETVSFEYLWYRRYKHE